MKKQTALLSALLLFVGSLTLSGCILHHDHGWHGRKGDGDRGGTGDRSDRGGRDRGGRSGTGSGGRR